MKRLCIISLIVLSFSACFSPWSGGKGTLVIHLPGSSAYRSASAARSIVTDDEAANLRYDFTLNGPGGIISGSVSGQTSFSADVVPGQWTVSVKGYGKKHGYQDVSEIALRAMGTAEVSVSAGQTNHASIGMVTVTEVTTWKDLWDAVNTDPHEEREEYIIVKNDLTVDAAAETALIQRKITILADTESVTIGRGSGFASAFFVVGQEGQLILGEAGSAKKLILDGMNITPVDKSLVVVAGENSVFIMNDGVTLRNNDISYLQGSNGGGVYIDSDGTFIMNGGKISGNSAGGSGGGVFLGDSAEFIMEGGAISDNNAASSGGGVNVESAKFVLNNGTISGNRATSNNDGNGGGGVLIKSGAKFTMENGVINRNNASNNGGGVYLTGNNTEFTMNGGIIGTADMDSNGNMASSSGGGMYIDAAALFIAPVLSNISITGNIAVSGGGIYRTNTGVIDSNININDLESRVTNNGGAPNIYLEY